MPEVYSSHVDRVDYDIATKKLTVQWKKGKASVYENVPPEVYNSVRNAPSVGAALRESIKGKYDHSYADDSE